MPWAPAALGAVPGGRLPEPGTATKAGCVENEPIPEEGAVCLLAMVPVSFKLSSAPNPATRPMARSVSR